MYTKVRGKFCNVPFVIVFMMGYNGRLTFQHFCASSMSARSTGPSSGGGEGHMPGSGGGGGRIPGSSLPYGHGQGQGVVQKF